MEMSKKASNTRPLYISKKLAQPPASLKFWDKVLKCKHENLDPNYYEYIGCPTPYCSGSETHCLDCGVFISECGCGYNNGMSGWSHKRWQQTKGSKKYGSNI